MPGSNPERSCGLLEDKARNDITGSSIETTLGLALSGFAGTLFVHYFLRGEVSASIMTGLGLSLGLFTTAAGVGRLVTSHAELGGIVTAKFVSRFLSAEHKSDGAEDINLAQ